MDRVYYTIDFVEYYYPHGEFLWTSPLHIITVPILTVLGYIMSVTRPTIICGAVGILSITV